jgi:succinate dehydrogenase/fumarate reductase flavoprotein subunit
VQPNFLLPLLRKGIDPFSDPFPVTLRGEGTIRGTGGVALSGPDCQAGVEGLYAAGDVASRQPIVGAASGGGQPNSAWCVASCTWSGRAAARRAGHGRVGLAACGDAESSADGGRPGTGGSASWTNTDTDEARRVVSRELNDLDKNMFRSGDGLRRSLALLDDLWTQLPDHAGLRAGRGSAGRDVLRARETAALVAAARWVLSSAIARQESRGMHERIDAPGRDPAFTATVRSWGLDAALTSVEPAGERQAAKAVAS